MNYIKRDIEDKIISLSKGAILCIRLELSAVNTENYIVPIWMI